MNTVTHDKGNLYAFKLRGTDRSPKVLDCAYSWESEKPYRKGLSLIFHPPFSRVAWGVGLWTKPVGTLDEQEKRMGFRSIGSLVENDVWLEIE